MLELSRLPSTSALVGKLIASWPEHERFLTASFRDRPERLLQTGEHVAGIILQLSETVPGGLPEILSDYRALCGAFLEEEIFFRREERYRLTKFADADREVYSNTALMGRYLNWILLSHVMMYNHAAAIDSFRHDYLERCAEGGSHLEVGPGHGLLLYFAAASGKFKGISGWDVSATSLAHAERNLRLMGVTQPIALTLRDVVAAPAPQADSDRFSSITISEVLEHVEDPHGLLQRLVAHLRVQGDIWINVPINSPAPDHIYLLRSIEEARDLVTSAGLTILDEKHCPMSGATLERALKHQLTVNCTFSARRER